MFLDNLRFPVDISYGSVGGPGYNTTVAEVTSGKEARNINWSQARHMYNAAFGVRSDSQLYELIEFFHAVRGKAIGFRYKDWLDFKGSFTVSILQNSTPIQMIKEYPNGVIREIKKPVPGTVKMYLNGEPVFYGIDHNTGKIQIPQMAVGTLKVDYEFDVPCRLDIDTLSLSLDSYNSGSTDVPIVELKI
jgi:uncharacterized protein (TIGR02217 family)